MVIITWVGLPIDFLGSMDNLPIDAKASEVYHLPLPSGHYYLGWTPYRFPGIDREPAYRYPVVIINWVGLPIDSLEFIGSLPVDSRKSVVYHLPYPVVIITWVGLPIDSLKSIGRLPIDSRESIGSPTQVIMTTVYGSNDRII